MAEQERQARFEREEPITDTFVPPVEMGQVLAGHYRLVREIGRGGMGVVWLANDENVGGRSCALKFLPPHVKDDPAAFRDLENEAEKIALLDHPNIVTLYGFEKDWDQPFLIFKYVEGVRPTGAQKTCYDLRAFLAANGPLSEREVRQILPPILQALDHAHNLRLEDDKVGVVHLDIKPDNVLLAPCDSADGLGFHPLLTDFGIAMEIRDTVSRTSGMPTIRGSLPYMSPEQISGKTCGARSDIYSLGMAIYEMLTGKPPFYTGDIGYQHMHEPVPETDGVSDEMNDLIQRAVAKSPRDRWASCLVMRRALTQSAEPDGTVGERESDVSAIQENGVLDTTSLSGMAEQMNRRPSPVVLLLKLLLSFSFCNIGALFLALALEGRLRWTVMETLLILFVGSSFFAFVSHLSTRTMWRFLSCSPRSHLDYCRYLATNCLAWILFAVLCGFALCCQPVRGPESYLFGDFCVYRALYCVGFVTCASLIFLNYALVHSKAPGSSRSATIGITAMGTLGSASATFSLFTMDLGPVVLWDHKLYLYAFMTMGLWSAAAAFLLAFSLDRARRRIDGMS